VASRAFGGLLILPLAGFLLEALWGEGRWTARPEAWKNTLLVAGGAMGVSLVLGIPVGLVLAHARTRAVHALVLLPLLIPPALGAAAWMLLPLPAPGPGACALILGITSWPIVALFLWASLSRLPQGALDSGFLQLSEHRLLAGVIWPHVRPAVLASSALVFLLAASDFTVPATFALPTVATVLYERLSVFQYASAAWTALPLLVLGAGLALGLRRIPILPQTGRPRAFLGPRSLALSCALGAGVWTLSVGLPVLLFSLHLGSAPALFRNVAVNLPSFAWSALVAGASAGLLVAWSSVSPGRSRLEPLWLAGLLVPGIVTALGTLGLAGRLGVQSTLSPSGALYVIALMSRFAYAAWLPLREPVARAPLEAAELAGLSKGRIAWTLVLPSAGPRAFSTLAVVFILSLGEIGPAVLLNPPGPPSVVQHLFNGLHYREIETVSALSLVLFVSAALVAWGGMYVGHFHRT
jgi:ABC-type Fe3+ transport system permease subunit